MRRMSRTTKWAIVLQLIGRLVTMRRRYGGPAKISSVSQPCGDLSKDSDSIHWRATQKTWRGDRLGSCANDSTKYLSADKSSWTPELARTIMRLVAVVFI
jgi:hypothetical protein